jgi:hypothetical protein
MPCAAQAGHSLIDDRRVLAFLLPAVVHNSPPLKSEAANAHPLLSLRRAATLRGNDLPGMRAAPHRHRHAHASSAAT